MKVLVVGASGMVGKAVSENLAKDHTVIRASRSAGDVRVDVKDAASVKAMFEAVGELDAIVTTTGQQAYGSIEALTSEDFLLGLTDKVMGQLNVVLAGQKALREGGCFTLTSGIMNDPPFQGGICAFTDNAAIESFVRVAAVQLPKKLRINVVSPAVVIESKDKPLPAEYVPPGLRQVIAADVALCYRRSIEEGKSGEIYEAHG